MHNPFSLQGKTLLVTGASSGIGRATAVECSKMGARLILTARNGERLEQTRLMLSAPETALVIPANQGSDAEAKKLVEQLPAEGIDGVVHCAGITKVAPLTFLKEADVESLIRTDLMAPIYLNKYLLKKKKMNPFSSIVMIASDTALRAEVGLTVYSAAKAGVVASVKVLAKELLHRNIRVNAICPAMIATEMTSPEALGYSEEQLQTDKESYFLGRYGKPEEVAYMAIYLLSDAAHWITGNVYAIDGGRLLL